MKSADVKEHIESVELDDDFKGIINSCKYSSNVCTSFVIIGDWRSDFEHQIAYHSSLPRPQLARTVCQHMYTNYPDITWVVLVYEPITGFDAHTVMANDQTHSVFRHHGHNAIISRRTGNVITTDLGLEKNLYDSFTPTCYRYCHDPACWNKYYHVYARQTVVDTWDKLGKLNILNMLFVVQHRFSFSNYAGRRDSSTGLLNGGPVSGTCLWDKRVVEKQIKTTCDGQYAQLMVLGMK